MNIALKTENDSYDVEKVKFQLKLELNKLQEALANKYKGSLYI